MNLQRSPVGQTACLSASDPDVVLNHAVVLHTERLHESIHQCGALCLLQPPCTHISSVCVVDTDCTVFECSLRKLN